MVDSVERIEHPAALSSLHSSTRFTASGRVRQPRGTGEGGRQDREGDTERAWWEVGPVSSRIL
ncbi:MAG: hypothetical protein M0Z77_09715 [Thermoplasmatales archaeon]|nr:hypothetical protein [Candidatus Thermoplasmatota archaeon]MDA8055902.1 hypothetical protein [Thermoplasmatales archaeon]